MSGPGPDRTCTPTGGHLYYLDRMLDVSKLFEPQHYPDPMNPPSPPLSETYSLEIHAPDLNPQIDVVE